MAGIVITDMAFAGHKHRERVHHGGRNDLVIAHFNTTGQAGDVWRRFGQARSRFATHFVQYSDIMGFISRGVVLSGQAIKLLMSFSLSGLDDGMVGIGLALLRLS